MAEWSARHGIFTASAAKQQIAAAEQRRENGGRRRAEKQASRPASLIMSTTAASGCQSSAAPGDTAAKKRIFACTDGMLNDLYIDIGTMAADECRRRMFLKTQLSVGRTVVNARPDLATVQPRQQGSVGQPDAMARLACCRRPSGWRREEYRTLSH